tara:strand:- start:561 stop:866 length:306 start_codon:yes stop_codon:yes gene_type:complete
MKEAGNLNTYNIRYRTFTESGILDFLTKKQIVEADSQLNALEILKSKEKEAGGGEIRIDNIEKMNADEIKKEKKKSPFLWIFFAAIAVASLAKVSEMLFSF